MIPSDTYSCLMSASFEWSIDAASGMVSTPQQAYKFRTRVLNNVDNIENSYPLAVVDTRLKVKGHGKVMSLRYESEEGKDFQLIGHSTPFTVNTEG